jgi:putative restriction endonuclease
MKFYVGVTDYSWFRFQADHHPDEVNFWQPSGGRAFKAIDPIAPFLFKLHSPINKITGGGFFVRHTSLPLSIAWDTFGVKNGAPDYATFAAKIRNYRERKGERLPDPVIGCIVLTNPFFFEEHEWITAPEDWSPNLVQGKTYQTSTPIGAHLWEAVQERLGRAPVEQALLREQSAQYGTEYLTRGRLGQGAFRVLVTEAYNRRCAITGERTLPVLQAAHIKPFAASGPNHVDNGLLLRADLHILFDQGFLTINNSLQVEVSQRIKSEYENGKAYYALHGRPLAVVPGHALERPSTEFLVWHNDHVYVP